MKDNDWNGGWTQTFTGVVFRPNAPRVEDINIEDIAHALAHICRYGGHAKRFYSVAEHSVLVSYLVPPEYAREGLLHDGAEAYIGDMVRPLKRLPQMAGFLEAEAVVEGAICAKFGTRNDPETRAIWKEFDDRILVDEVAEVMPRPDLYQQNTWFATLKATGAPILCYPPERAEMLFLARFGELFPEYVRADELEIVID